MSPSAGERTDEDYEAAGDLAPRQRERIDALWMQLNGGGGGGADAGGARSSGGKIKTGSGAGAGGDGGGDGGGANGGVASKGRAALDILAKLNRTASGGVGKKPSAGGGKGGTAKKAAAANDSSWARSLGLNLDGKQRQPSTKSPASAATLAAARDALAKAGGREGKGAWSL